MTFCGAKLQSGFDMVADLTELRARIGRADLVITGEGRLDGQTLNGKGPIGVAAMARLLGRCVVGIGGLVGSGRSELLDALFGLDGNSTGQVLVGGTPLDRSSPRQAIREGIGYVPEDRRLQGLFFQLGLAENILIPIMPRLARAGLADLGVFELQHVGAAGFVEADGLDHGEFLSR